MDANPPPFPAKKSQCVKSKYNKKINEPTSKANTKDPSTQRQKRVFGVARNPNIPTNPTTQKPVTKPSSRASQTQPIFTKSTQPSGNLPEAPVVIEPAKKSIGENRTKPKKKSVCFQENTEEIVVTEPKTPLKSPYMAKPSRLSGTPYYTAQRCTNCRLDRLETSAYWLTQIKQAETLQKHFVSVAFFHLAYESKAEPIHTLRVELKKYLARHELLSAETEWINVSRTYGLLKEDKTNGDEGALGCGDGATSDASRQSQDQA
ncbi:nucleolar protein dao-5-like [Heracleum sosnowskyi]|uniref:Nucleolar protein dao-5-like n=1 Tax=Heracleum sosnowskyi TaxID=360622 RepID=A0AAD8IXX9_9APIA|nr:nucleolar protein dao-5-like [Heracleum sosnowskyi]